MPASIAETMRFSGCYASMFERTRFTDARAAPDESARSAPRTCVFVFSLGHELLSKKGCVFVTSGLPSSQRTSARCSRVVRMAGHGNANPVLTRMPSLADWQMHAAGDVAAVLAAAREQTEKVAGDLTAAAAAPSAGVAENRETVEACAEPAAPPVTATVSRMPSLGAWAMSDYMQAAERAEEEVPNTSRDEEGNTDDGEARVGEAPATRVGEAAKEAVAPLSITEPPGANAMPHILSSDDETAAPSDDATGEKRKSPEKKTALIAGATTKPKRCRKSATAALPTRRSARARGEPPT